MPYLFKDWKIMWTPHGHSLVFIVQYFLLAVIFIHCYLFGAILYSMFDFLVLTSYIFVFNFYILYCEFYIYFYIMTYI